jgi:hypothetical protein
MYIKNGKRVPERTNISPTKEMYNMYNYGGSSLVLGDQVGLKRSL